MSFEQCDVTAAGTETRADVCEGQQTRDNPWQWGRLCKGNMNACLYVNWVLGGGAKLCWDLAVYQKWGPRDKHSIKSQAGPIWSDSSVLNIVAIIKGVLL